MKIIFLTAASTLLSIYKCLSFSAQYVYMCEVSASQLSEYISYTHTRGDESMCAARSDDRDDDCAAMRFCLLVVYEVISICLVETA